MRRMELEAQADRLELVLAQHKAPAQVTGGTVTPGWMQFLLHAAPGVKVQRFESLSREIALALGVPEARVVAAAGQLRVDVPRSDPQTVRFSDLLARVTLPAGTALLGLADDGAPLLINLASPEVGHVLVAGTTGSGKTALLQTLAASLVLTQRPSRLQLAVIDPKGYSFAAFRSAAQLFRPIATQPDQALTLLEALTTLLDARVTQANPKPHVVLVIDELADLVQTVGQQVIDRVGRLVQRGRSAGLHVVAATQKPSSALIGPIVKANFPVRLVGRVTSGEDARVAAGRGGTQAERLRGRGDFLAIFNLGVQRFQAAYLTMDELERQFEKLAS
jgi:S-DNA-T family DNA segregation ATPase FtsK/SpoIIIE